MTTPAAGVLFVLEDIDELAQRVPQEETPHSPWFKAWAVFDGNAGAPHALQRLLKIVHFYGQVGDGRIGAALIRKAYLHRHLLELSSSLVYGRR